MPDLDDLCATCGKKYGKHLMPVGAGVAVCPNGTTTFTAISSVCCLCGNGKGAHSAAKLLCPLSLPSGPGAFHSTNVFTTTVLLKDCPIGSLVEVHPSGWLAPTQATVLHHYDDTTTSTIGWKTKPTEQGWDISCMSDSPDKERSIQQGYRYAWNVVGDAPVKLLSAITSTPVYAEGMQCASKFCKGLRANGGTQSS